ncbi:MAG: hypothetical protein IJG23_07035 [Clostridia bacterium]|nr:hypothetical protein [Clostridia bacterium]
MKKVAKILIIYTIVVSLIVGGLNAVYMRFMSVEEEIKKFQNVPNHIKICNFGSSHGINSFNYDNVNQTCFNFALSAQYPIYDERVLEQYANCIDDNATVYLVVSFFSFYGIPEEKRDIFESKNKRYYQILSKDKIIQYSLKTDICERYLPILTADEKIFENYFNNKTVSKDSSQSKKVEKDNQYFQNDAKKKYQHHMIEDKLDEEGNRIINNAEIEAIYHMIEFCRSKNIRAIMVTTPYTQEYCQEIKKNDSQFLQEFYSLVNEISAQTNTQYLDYSADKRFRNNHALFIDSDHLNTQGAKQFTQILLHETNVDYGESQ